MSFGAQMIVNSALAYFVVSTRLYSEIFTMFREVVRDFHWLKIIYLLGGDYATTLRRHVSSGF